MFSSLPSDTISKFLTFLGIAFIIYGFSIYENSGGYPAMTTEQRIAFEKADSLKDELDRTYSNIEFRLQFYSDRKIDTIAANSLGTAIIYADLLESYSHQAETVAAPTIKKVQAYKDVILKRNLYMGLGVLLFLIGLNWWNNEENLKKRILKSELILKGGIYTICQSCSIQMTTVSIRGTEADDSPSPVYCKNCYQSGKFVKPNLTYENALNKLISKLGNNANSEHGQNLIYHFRFLYRWRGDYFDFEMSQQRRTELFWEKYGNLKTFIKVIIAVLICSFFIHVVLYNYFHKYKTARNYYVELEWLKSPWRKFSKE